MSLSKVVSLLPTVFTGVVAVIIGFVSSVAIIFQAASAAGATPGQTSSWIFAVCLGAGLVSIIFSLYYRMPILAAWSTPGAALLSLSLHNVPMNEIIGAFVLSGTLAALVGITGLFDKVVKRVPVAIASAMLAGVLLKFGIDVFVALKTEASVVIAMLLTYFVTKRFIPRYAVICVLIVGVLLCGAKGLLHFEEVHFAIVQPVFVMPAFSWNVLIGIGVPLFIVTMASQNLPGVAVLKTSGYHPAFSPIIAGTGIATLLLAPFGGFSVNLAAFTAAICAGPEAHKDPKHRYVASVAAGIFYLVVALLSSAIIALLSAFPKELVFALGGIALFGTISNSLLSAVREDRSREAAVITFLVSASGVSLFGIGAPFWGLVAGVIALMATKPST